MSSDRTSSLERFVNELAKAWKKLTLYPDDHPARTGAMDHAVGLLRTLIATTQELKLGVARDGLVVGDDKISAGGGAELARALYERNVAVVRFKDKLTTRELERFLSLLRPIGKQQPEPLADELARARVVKIETETVDYALMVATDGLGGPVAGLGKTSLWDRILRARLGDTEMLPPSGQAAFGQVVDLINQYLPRGSSAPVSSEARVAPEIVQLMELLAEAVDDHLGEASDLASDRLLTRQVAELVGALPEAFRTRFLAASLARIADSDKAANKVDGLVASASATDMLTSLRQLRDHGQHFSQHSLKVIENLSQEASKAKPDGGVPLRDDIKITMATVLLDGAGQLDSGSDDFVLKLPEAPVSPIVWSEELEKERQSLTTAAVTQSLLKTLLALLRAMDLDAVGAISLTKRLENVFADLVISGRPFVAAALVQHLRSLAETRDDMTGTGIRRLLDRLEGSATADVLGQVLRRADDDQVSQLQHLVEVLGPEVIRHLLVAMCEVEDRVERRQIYNFVKAQGPRLVPEAIALLKNNRWFVVRNMISLLREVPSGNVVPDVSTCLKHEEPRVRIEAAKFLIAEDPSLSPDLIGTMLSDTDPKVSTEVIDALGKQHVRSAVVPLLSIATQRDAFGKTRELRLMALRSLGQIGDPTALPQLRGYFALVLSGRSLEDKRAAFAALGGYPVDARRPYVRKGLRARDAEIKSICRQLAALETNA